MNVPPDLDRAVLPALEHFPKQEYWQAPYGAIWYAVNKPIGTISLGSAEMYMFWTGWFTSALLVFLSQFQSILFLLVFSGIAMFHLVKAPWNVSILWLCLLGLIHPFLLIVPILAKFPVGNPAPFRKTWNHALHAIPYKMSPVYYLSMGIVWLSVAFHL